MKAIKFLMPYTQGTLYQEGETASFADDIADDLVKREIAEEVKITKKPAAKSAA